MNGAFHGMAHVNSFSPQQVCFKYGLPWDCVSRAVRTFQQYFLPYFSYNLPYAAQEVNSPSPPSFLPGRKALLELLLFDTFLIKRSNLSVFTLFLKLECPIKGGWYVHNTCPEGTSIKIQN